MKRVGHLKEIAYDNKTLLMAVKASKKSKRVKSLFKRGKLTSESAIAEIINDYHFHGDYTPITVTDESSGKVRKAFKPSIHDVLTQNAYWCAIKAPIRRGMDRWSCGAVEGRGPDRLAMHVHVVVDSDRKRCRRWAKLDVVGCYPSIKRSILRTMFYRVIKDHWALKLFEEWLSKLPGEDGLCIGDLMSKEMANFYFQSMDHYIREQLHVDYYHRYMDDTLLICSSYRKLRKAVMLIVKFCKERLGVTLHMKQLHVKVIPYRDKEGDEKGEPIDICGYRIYRRKVSMRRRVSIKARRSILRQNRKPSVARAKSLVSRYGRYMKRTNHFVLDERYHASKVFEGCKHLLRRQNNAKVRSCRVRKSET